MRSTPHFEQMREWSQISTKNDNVKGLPGRLLSCHIISPPPHNPLVESLNGALNASMKSAGFHELEDSFEYSGCSQAGQIQPQTLKARNWGTPNQSGFWT